MLTPGYDGLRRIQGKKETIILDEDSGHRETKPVMRYQTCRAIVSLRRNHFHRSTEHFRLCEILKLIGWIDLVFLCRTDWHSTFLIG